MVDVKAIITSIRKFLESSTNVILCHIQMRASEKKFSFKFVWAKHVIIQAIIKSIKPICYELFFCNIFFGFNYIFLWNMDLSTTGTFANFDKQTNHFFDENKKFADPEEQCPTPKLGIICDYITQTKISQKWQNILRDAEF